MIRLLITCLAIGLAAPASAEPLAKTLFGGKTDPTSKSSQSFGSYAKGCLDGAVQLPQSGRTWQAMRLSRNRNWGHPELIKFLKRLSKKARHLGAKGIYIGDMSQPRGGPMKSGHRSHQIGLDADIWMMPAMRVDLTRKERENLSAVSYRRQKGAFVNSRWSSFQHEIIKAAAQDPRVARIFVFPGAKVQMCKDEKGDRAWLNKIRPWWGHHYHFHVRLKCQKGSKNCVNQAPPPPGDGCAAAQKWVDDILNPPPPDPNAKPHKRHELVMSDLPRQCARILKAR